MIIVVMESVDHIPEAGEREVDLPRLIECCATHPTLVHLLTASQVHEVEPPPPLLPAHLHRQERMRTRTVLIDAS